MVVPWQILGVIQRCGLFSHLLLRNRILQQNQMRQPRQIPQRIQIRQFSEVVRRQYQRRQIR